MTLYKRKDSQFYWVKFSPIKGELKAFMQSTETTNKRQAQQYHDKLQGERWEQDKLGVRPRHTWDEAAAKFLEETQSMVERYAHVAPEGLQVAAGRLDLYLK